jgi:hypothetical protein
MAPPTLLAVLFIKIVPYTSLEETRDVVHGTAGVTRKGFIGIQLVSRPPRTHEKTAIAPPFINA